MKKTYQQPETVVTDIEVQNLMTVSGNKVTVTSDETVDDVNDLLSRPTYNVWGDDEDIE